MEEDAVREPPGLSGFEERLLRFEADAPTRPGAKEAAIREQFGLSPARYYQLLHALIDSPAAVRFDPLLLGRLHRARDARRRARAGLRLGSAATPHAPTDQES